MSDTKPDRPRRKTNKKKKRSASASAEPAARPRRRRPEPEPPPEQQWTSGHMVMAAVVGLAVGGLGGYYGGGNKGTDASKGAVASASPDAAKSDPATGAANAKVNPPNARPAPPPSAPTYIALAENSPRHGPKHAKVTILEFSDFQ